MSAIVRQQLIPALNSVLRDLAQGDTHLQLPDSPDSLEALGVLADNVARKIRQIQGLLNEWTTILSSADSEVRQEENALFASFSVGPKFPGDILMEAQDSLAKLELKIDKIRALNAAQPESEPRTGPPRAQINLPSLQLPDFDGNEGRWPSFWAAFENTIHANPSLTNSQKLTYLVGRIKGNARSLVDGFSLTDGNYAIVVDLLKGRFGDEKRRADQLRSELFHLQKPSAHSSSLRAFSEQVDRICRQLEGLGTNLDDNPFLTVAIKEKLPVEIKTILYDKEMEEGGTWTSKQWRERLYKVVRLREAVHAPWEHSEPSRSHQPKPAPLSHFPKPTVRFDEPIKRSFPVVASQRAGEGDKCSLCLQEGHKPSKCAVYRTAEQRIGRLIAQGRCSRCARDGHQHTNCTSSIQCFRCGEPHHPIVCPKPEQPPARGSNFVPLGIKGPGPRSGTKENNPKKSTSFLPFVTPPEANTQIISSISQFPPIFPSNQHSGPRPKTYLMINTVYAFNRREPSKPVSVPVFYDPGSQPRFITGSLVSRIDPLLIEEEDMSVCGFSGNVRSKTLKFSSPRFAVKLLRRDGCWEELELNQTAKIVPAVEYLREVGPVPSKNDNIVVSVAEPQILIGISDFWKFFMGQKEIYPGIYKIDTVFGPVFGGEMVAPPIPHPQSFRPSVCVATTRVATTRVSRPEESVQNLWSLESIGIHESPDTDDDEFAKILVKNTIKFSEGRYSVGWPWRPGAKERLPTNFSLAYSRLSHLSQKLRSNPEFREKYQSVIADQLERGVIELTTRTGAAEHFIPHHAVVNPKKLRIVYDASAREKGKPSLNDSLLPGPNLVPELAGVLLRFRCAPYPLLADIEKAFLAVGLQEEDRESAKFLWLKNPALPPGPENLEIYRFKRIAFGVNSSPFLLATVLQHHLMAECPMGAALAKNFYVDNLLISSTSVEEAKTAIHHARRLLASAGMKLREFVAAESTILAGLPAEDVLAGEEQRVLGISWNLTREQLTFVLPSPRDFPPTRRGILGAIASLFDPLGLCCPCIVKAKIFFQSLWDTKKGWDDSLGDLLERQWKNIASEWEGEGPPSLVAFPRLTPCHNAQLQLHVFSDAGPFAYSAAVYLRTEGDNGAQSNLLFAKSRLRPKKLKDDGLTIPRLELLGLLVAVRAKNFVLANLDQTIDKVYFWVDSQIVLSWLCSTAPQPSFILNRLSEIRKEKMALFKYVRSADNPADLGTRGVSPKELNQSSLWRFGPNWLTQPAEKWPNEYREIILPQENSIASESDSQFEVAAPITVPRADPILLNPRRFSSWSRLLVVTTFTLYFLSKFLKGVLYKEKFPFLTRMGPEPSANQSRKVAKLWILRREQVDITPGDDIYLAKDGLYRLRTRLAHARQPEDFKNPIVLPRESWITRLIILSVHSSLAHAGVDYTLTGFLGEFWCPRVRRLIKGILRDCLICKRDRAAKFALPPMPPLPTARVTPNPPFSHVGLDYLGPTLFKSPEGPKKAWILLLTCLGCRAVHLEIVTSLDTSEFLAGFRRFVARRGIPRKIWSDNGTQIVLGRQLLMTYYELPVEWTLIPPPP